MMKLSHRETLRQECQRQLEQINAALSGLMGVSVPPLQLALSVETEAASDFTSLCALIERLDKKQQDADMREMLVRLQCEAAGANQEVADAKGLLV